MAEHRSTNELLVEERRPDSSLPYPHDLEDTRIGQTTKEEDSVAKRQSRQSKQVFTNPPAQHPRSSKKVFFWVILGVVIVFLLILLFGWLPRHARNKETQRRAEQGKSESPEVEVIRVSRAKEGSGLVVPGTTAALTEAAVYARANGYLKKRFVDIGDHVRKGQLLAVIDAPDLDQQVDQARQQLSQTEAQLTQQRTQLALTKVTGDRYRALVAKGVFSRQEGDQREADYQAQLANVNAAERNVEAFRANLRRVIALQGYERVTAPFAGVVTQRNVDAGDLISASGSAGGASLSPGQSGSGTQGMNATNSSGSSGNGSSLAGPATGGGQGGSLFSIAQSGRLRILVSVPEGYASEVHAGQGAMLHFQELPNGSIPGTVTRTSGTIDQNTRTLLTEIQVENADGHLLPGMYAVVTFMAARGAGPLLISSDAVAIRKDQPTVAVISNGKVKLTPITVGRDYGPEVEVMNGLQEGDLIASTFTDDVQEGASVRTREDQQAEQKRNPPAASGKSVPPGGSTQYGDPGITDQDMQGQNAKSQLKKPGAGKNETGGSKSGSR